MKVIVTGSDGQLGSDILKVFGESTIGFSHAEFEVTDMEMCENKIKNIDCVINCAAYVRVDDCEDNPQEAFMVNAIGAKNIASVCNKRNVTSVYISTDFVFDGNKSTPYEEGDIPNPLNLYGLTKYAGEIFTKNYAQKSYIIRTASLYGLSGTKGKGGNFIDFIMEKYSKNEEIEIVNDIYMSPTYTKDLANMIKIITEKNLPFGIYHIVNEGHCSWYNFATEVFNLLHINAKIIPITIDKLNRKARRPLFTPLINKKLKNFNLHLRSWKEALQDYIKEKYK